MNLTFITPIFILQFATFILFILSLIFGILCSKKFKKMRLFVTPLLTYVGHVIVFYSFILYTSIIATKPLYYQIINGWSSGIRLHLALLLFVEFAVLLFGGEKWIQSK